MSSSAEATASTPLLHPQHPITVYDSQLSHPERSHTSPPYFRDSPLKLVIYDLGVVLRHAAQIPNIFLPLSTTSDIAPTGVFVQVIFTLVSLALTGLGVFSFTTGFVAPIVAAGLITLTIVVMSRLQGREVKMEKQGGGDDKLDDEAWLFVNGIATSGSGLQLILSELYKVFGRRVTGIHNKTFGIWWDLVECVLQRDFLWATADVRVGYQEICRHIRNPRKTKIVLIAHSQGGIIMSTWVLLSDFSADALRKVEIYTFASAANHFSVPSSPINSDDSTHIENAEQQQVQTEVQPEAKGTGSRQIGRRAVFGCVEHFVNTKDYVSLIGLLTFAPPPPLGTIVGTLPTQAAEGRFAGRIFRREGHTGHLLLAHYLKTGDSILSHPTAKQYSQLTKYIGGRTAEVEDRLWKESVATDQDDLPQDSSTS